MQQNLNTALRVAKYLCSNSEEWLSRVRIRGAIYDVSDTLNILRVEVLKHVAEESWVAQLKSLCTFAQFAGKRLSSASSQIVGHAVTRALRKSSGKIMINVCIV